MATTVDYSYKQIWRVAYPILVSLLMEQMIVLTDTAFMGRVGEVELGAAAIAGVFYMVYLYGWPRILRGYADSDCATQWRTALR